MVHPNQIDGDLVCPNCKFMLSNEWATNADRSKIMSNGILTCKGCHRGLGAVEEDGSISLYDEVYTL